MFALDRPVRWKELKTQDSGNSPGRVFPQEIFTSKSDALFHISQVIKLHNTSQLSNTKHLHTPPPPDKKHDNPKQSMVLLRSEPFNHQKRHHISHYKINRQTLEIQQLHNICVSKASEHLTAYIGSSLIKHHTLTE